MNKNLIAILAILLIIISAGVISAMDNTGIDTNTSSINTDNIYLNGTLLKNANNTINATPSLGVAHVVDNKTSIDNNNDTNGTHQSVNATPGVIIKSIDTPDKVVSANASANIGSLRYHATGNPILGLVCVSSALVSCAIFRRKYV